VNETPRKKIVDATPAPAREGLGLSRAVLSQLSGVPQSRCWAAAQDSPKDVAPGHLKAIIAALDTVDREGLPEHLVKAKKSPSAGAPTKAALQDRLKNVVALLGEAAAAKTPTAIRAIIDRAQAAATGGTDEPTESVATDLPEPSEDDEPEPADQPTTDELVAA